MFKERESSPTDLFVIVTIDIHRLGHLGGAYIVEIKVMCSCTPTLIPLDTNF